MPDSKMDIDFSLLSSAEQNELVLSYTTFINGLSVNEKNCIRKEAARRFKKLCEDEWPDATPALSETLLRKGFKTKSEGSNLDRQIARWKNEGLPYKTAFRLVLALEKPASALLPTIESMEEGGVAAKPVLGLKKTDSQKTERAEEAIVVAESLAISRSGTAKLPVRRKALVLTSSIALICLLGVLISGVLVNHEGEIFYPSPNALMDPKIPVTGKTTNISNDYYIWLVVEVDDLWWVKANVPRNTRFETFIREDGKPKDGKFTLSLYAVSQDWHDHFLAWLSGGREIDHYPGGVKRIPRENKLHSIPLILKDH